MLRYIYIAILVTKSHLVVLQSERKKKNTFAHHNNTEKQILTVISKMLARVWTSLYTWTLAVLSKKEITRKEDLLLISVNFELYVVVASL